MEQVTGSLEASFEAVTHAPAVERPALSGARVSGSREAFVDGYLRRGSEIELKSFTGVTPGDGGYAVPREIDAQIDRTLTAISPIRRIANVVRVGSAGYRKLVTTGGTPSGWASEVGARNETATPTFREIAPAMGELFANPAASQAMLDDAAFDVESWLGQEIATEFARAEGAAFVMNSATLARIRKFKTSDGAFLWQPAMASGQPDTLLGYPVVEAEDMPDIAADAYAIAFGNFRAGYLIAERQETAILRDPFTHKPFVHFYATKRIGGVVLNSEAIKLMRFSAS
jgi:predicted phage gp36 major capsid-like protein